MTDATIPYGRQDISEADVAAVDDCLRGEWLTQGPRVAEFESGLCAATGARHAIAVANGTAALHLAALGAGLRPGDLAVTSAISFVASANCLEYCGADVRFADVDPGTGLMCSDSLDRVIEQAVSEKRKPKLIVPVDLAGQVAPLDTIHTLAEKVGARVLSDAAHSLGAAYTVGGQRYSAAGCAHSDEAILSFHPVKNITTGEGGAILTNDAAMAARLLKLRAHGIHKDPARMSVAQSDPYVGPWYYEQDALGFNYRLTDIQCALGISQLGRLSEFMARRSAIAARYDEALSSADLAEYFQPLGVLPGSNSAYHLYVLQLRPADGEASESVAQRRKDLYQFLHARGVLSQVHYIPIPWQPFYREKYGHSRNDFPGATAYYSRSLSLPMYTSLSDQDQDYVIRILSDWVARQ